MCSNYPDNIRDFDNHPGSPFFNEPPPICPHCKEYCSEDDDLCSNCNGHTHEQRCFACKVDFVPEDEFQFKHEICESCLVEHDIEEDEDVVKFEKKQAILPLP